MITWAGIIRHRTVRRAFAIAAAAALLSTPVGGVGAGTDEPVDGQQRTTGVGIAPVILEYRDALRGGSYQRNLRLTNDDPTFPAEFTIEPIGDVASWVTVFDQNGAPSDSIVVPPDSFVNLTVTVDVPADAVSRSYEGGLEVLAAITDDPGTVGEGEGGAGVQTGGLVLIDIDVTGTEVRAASLADVRVSNAEVGMEQRFTAVVQNDGNVIAVGQLDVTILRDGAAVAQLTSEGGAWVAQPGASGNVEVVWPTAEERAGDYTAVFEVADVAGTEPVELGSREASFRLEPVGTFTRSGELTDLKVLSELSVAAPVVVQASFFNTGQIETTAVFGARLFQGEELVDVVQSLGRAAQPGETVGITQSFDITEPGRYRVEGEVNYDGFVTGTQTLDLEVVDPASGTVTGRSDSEDGVDVVTIAAVVAAGLVVLAIVWSLVRRRRGGASQTRTKRRTGGRRDGVEYAPVEPARLPGARTAANAGDRGRPDRSSVEFGEREIDPEVMAQAMRELDEELGLSPRSTPKD